MLGIRLPEVEASEYHIATPEQVHALHEALPERPIRYVAAGCGWRAGEALGAELNHIDLDSREMHVRQQLVVLSGRQPFLAPPKTKTSRRTNELPTLITKVLRDHIECFPPTPGEIDDETDPRNPVRRVASLLLTHDKGEPIHRARWLHIWQADSHRQATTSF